MKILVPLVQSFVVSLVSPLLISIHTVFYLLMQGTNNIIIFPLNFKAYSILGPLLRVVGRAILVAMRRT